MHKIYKFDLEERTSKFAEEIVDFCKRSPKKLETVPLLEQLLRSGTSIGANYYEANGASSKKDFRNKIFICKKESKETQYWLRLLAKSNDETKMICGKLWQEAHELTLIFSKIASSSK